MTFPDQDQDLHLVLDPAFRSFLIFSIKHKLNRTYRIYFLRIYEQDPDPVQITDPERANN